VVTTKTAVGEKQRGGQKRPKPGGKKQKGGTRSNLGWWWVCGLGGFVGVFFPEGPGEKVFFGFEWVGYDKGGGCQRNPPPKPPNKKQEKDPPSASSGAQQNTNNKGIRGKERGGGTHVVVGVGGASLPQKGGPKDKENGGEGLPGVKRGGNILGLTVRREDVSPESPKTEQKKKRHKKKKKKKFHQPPPTKPFGDPRFLGSRGPTPPGADPETRGGLVLYNKKKSTFS